MPRVLLLTLALLTLGCAAPASPSPAARGSTAAGDTRAPTASSPQRTLVIATRFERESMAGTLLHPLSGDHGTLRRAWNASLAQGDGDNELLPYLAEALPQLNTATWRVSADGRMETTYRLRPNLAWHDGKPLTAEDFVFAWRVYTNPDLGLAGATPFKMMIGAVAADPRTLVLSWSQPYPDAGALQAITDPGGPNFAPLPRHILETPYAGEKEAFLTHPFWTVEYVGAGPYKVDRWEPGAFVEGIAFEQHAWGRPKIDRIRYVFQPDSNTALANLLAGETHLTSDQTIRIQQGQILKREWEARNGGAVVYRPQNAQYLQFQHRPEYANPRAMLDLRVRRALAHAIDKQELNEGLFDGVGVMTDTMMYPTMDYFPALDRAITKYPFDPRRAEAYMAEAGFQKSPDGFFTSAAEGRPTFEFKTNTATQNDAWRAILVDGWRRAGFDAEQGVFTAGDTREPFLLASFRSMYGTGGNVAEAALVQFHSTEGASPANRWTGRNRGGWANAEFDRLVDSVQTTLDRPARVQRIIQAFSIMTDQLGVFPLWFPPSVVAYVSALKGYDVRAADAEPTWNMHTWELQ